jgi:putative phosphoesterase
MLRFLLIGDSHVPKRASSISEKIQEKLKILASESLFISTFFTGDEIFYPEFMKFLNSITREKVLRVIGNMDYYYGNKDAPTYQKLKINFQDNESMVIGLTHGAQIQPRGDRNQLESLALEKKYDILISGHTHKEEIHLTNKGILLLNPGSVTGAWSFVASGIASFMVLYIDTDTKDIDVNLFQLDKLADEVNENKAYFIFKDKKIKCKY